MSTRTTRLLPADAESPIWAPYRRLAFAVVFAVLMLDLPVFLYLGELAPPPKYFFGLIVVATLPILLAGRAVAMTAVAAPYLVACGGLAFAIVLAWLAAPASDAGAVATRLLTVVLSAYLALVAAAMPRREVQDVVRAVTAVALLALALSFVLPGVFLTRDLPGAVLGRASAFWVNPNRAAEAVLLLCILAMGALSRGGARMTLLLVTGAVILMTFSRGTLVVWVTVTLASAALGLVPRLALMVPVVAFMLLVPLGVLFSEHLVFALGLEAGAANVVERIQGMASFEALDYSASERMEALQIGIDAFLANSLTGQGVGSVEIDAGIAPHNQLVFLLAEYGVLGGVVFSAFVLAVSFGNRLCEPRLRIVGVIAVVALSLFTHNMLDAMYWTMALILFSQRACGEDGVC